MAGFLKKTIIIILTVLAISCYWDIATEGVDITVSNPTDAPVTIEIDGLKNKYTINPESTIGVHLPPFRGEYAQGTVTITPSGDWFTNNKQYFSIIKTQDITLTSDIAWIEISCDENCSNISALYGTPAYEAVPLLARNLYASKLTLLSPGTKAFLRIPFPATSSEMDVRISYSIDGQRYETEMKVQKGEYYQEKLER